MSIPQKPITFRVDEGLIEHIFDVQTSRDPKLSQAEAIRLILEQHWLFTRCGILRRRESTFQQLLRLLSGICNECSAGLYLPKAALLDPEQPTAVPHKASRTNARKSEIA